MISPSVGYLLLYRFSESDSPSEAQNRLIPSAVSFTNANAFLPAGKIAVTFFARRISVFITSAVSAVKPVNPTRYTSARDISSDCPISLGKYVSAEL